MVPITTIIPIAPDLEGRWDGEPGLSVRRVQGREWAGWKTGMPDGPEPFGDTRGQPRLREALIGD